MSMEFNGEGLVWDGALRSEHLALVEYWDAEGVVRGADTTFGNGWAVEVDAAGSWRAVHKELGLEFSMTLRGAGDSFTLTIPREGVKEFGTAKLKSLRPLPGLVADSEGGGSLVLPNDSGGLCHCRAKKQAEHKLPVFFPCPSPCNMPLFGVDFGGGKALAAVVEGGKFDFALFVRTCWGDAKRYSVDPEFAVRDYPDERPLAEDISIVYQRLSGAGAGWTQIAEFYRRYNLGTRGAPTLKEKINGNPTLEYSAKAITLRCRMAVKQMPTPILEQTPGNQPPMTVFMTFDNVRTLVEECARQQVGPFELCLVGWNYGGHDGAFPQLFPVEEQLGGERKLRSLIARSHELGYPLSLHDNYFDAYTLADNFDPEAVNRDHDGSMTLGGQYGGGQAYQVCPRRAYELYALKNLPAVAALGVKGTYYSDVISIAQLTKCYHPEHPVSRRDNAEWWKRIMRDMRKYFGGSQSEGARDWALPELDRAYLVSLLEKSNLPFVDADIPLFQVAYHGLLIYNSFRGGINTFPGEELYLRNLAYGGMPLFYYHQIFNPAWTSADGWDKDLKFGDADKLKADVAKIKRVTDDVAKLAPLQTEFIEDFVQRGSNLTETRYANGSSVFVNYSDEPCPLGDGLTVPPKDFIVKGASLGR